MFRFARSLKGKLAIMVAVAIIVTGAVVLLFSYFIARSILKDEIFRSVEGVSLRTARAVQILGQDQGYIANLLASRQQVRQDVETITSGAGDAEAARADLMAILNDVQATVPDFCDMQVIGMNGAMIAQVSNCSTPVTPLPSTASFPGVVKTVQAGKIFHEFDYAAQVLSATVAAGVLGTSGQGTLGMVALSGDSPRLTSELTNLAGLGDTGEITLSELRGGMVVAVNPAEHPGSTEETGEQALQSLDPKSGVPAVRAALGRSGTEEATDERGHKVVASYQFIPGLNWGITASEDSSEAFAPVARLRNVSLLVILVLLLGGVMLAYLIARNIARPLEELQQGVKALGSGELSTRVNIKDGVEVTGLAEEFNSMASRLDELYENLELKVDERTTELREANERLQELDDMKSDFVSVASHELRSPLASMKMGLSTVLKELSGPLTEEQKTLLGIVDRNMDRLEKLTTDLLDLTKVEAKQLDLLPGDVELVALAREVVESGQAQADQMGLALDVEADEAVVEARCDRDRIYQVVQNLVGNALKFTDEGSITVRVQSIDGAARVTVRDTGVGIPAEAMETVFDKFSQAHMETRSEKRGTGLGLAISKGIVEAHGGTIGAESTAGEGSSFWFTIPVSGPVERKQKHPDNR